MSKKNNRNKFKAYSEYLKEQEKLEEERRKQKQNKRDTNRIANTLVDEINDITLNLEKDQKMAIEKPETKRRHKVKAKKQKNTQ